MKIRQITMIVLMVSTTLTFGQTYKNWDEIRIAAFYKKAPVQEGTLGEDGKKISCIFVPSSMQQGTYEVTIVDYKNDLYEIKGTEYFVMFNSYVGNCGFYGKSGTLEVGFSSWSSKFYVKP